MLLRHFQRRHTIQSLKYGHRAFKRPFRTFGRRSSINGNDDDPDRPSFGQRVKTKIKEYATAFVLLMIIGGIANAIPSWEETLDATCRVVPPKIVRAPPISNKIHDPAHPDPPSGQKITHAEEFRILVLEPGSGTEEIRCSMRNVRPSWRTRYDALSYTWGDESVRKNIVLDDSRTSITKNLYTALVHLRHPVQQRYLWTDALCINQIDFEERDEQVKKMGAIYFGARNVIIWLGEETAEVKGAFSHIRGPYGDKSPKDWLTVFNLLRRPWFQRTWVIQEAVLARKPLLACGLDTTPWESLASCCSSDDFQEVLPHNDPEIDHALRAIDMITHGRQEHHTEYVVTRPRRGKRAAKKEKYTPDFGLISTLYETRGFQCKDKRDKVFGVLSLVTDVGPKDDVRELNSQTSLEEVFERVAKWDIQKNRNLELLSYCSRKAWTHPNLPSWVPDFTDIDETNAISFLQKMKVTRRQQHEKHKRRNERNSNPGLEERNQPLFQKENDKTVLVLSGRVIDTVARVGAVADNPKMVIASRKAGKVFARLDASAIARRQKWFYECVQIASQADPVRPIDNCETAATYWKAQNLGMSSYQIDCFLTAMTLGEVHEGEGVLEYAKFLYQDLGINPQWPETWKGNSKAGKSSRKSIDRSFRKIVHKRRFCATRTGKLGWVPGSAKEGDVICQFSGAQVPIILRKLPNVDRYSVVGDAYVHGLMRGSGQEYYIGGKRLNII